MKKQIEKDSPHFPQQRRPNGRFERKQGGSAEDVLVEVDRIFGSGWWTIKQLREESKLISNVVIRTTQGDVARGIARGWIESGKGYQYRLTRKGIKQATCDIKASRTHRDMISSFVVFPRRIICVISSFIGSPDLYL